ncbi:Tat pathway signal protein [Streptomyces chromofuscus]|uniref:Tat pathway signal protein n=1 Tax=Streptomyces chromofuscus TaxID=42881 RepID=A0A7M2T3B0_STRCW|nr:Tat pathway signal protein [Streptomyces chromofuscus]QOV43062.1 Tat pathway signal protein [Streptomyces chromofuscus]GGS93478.1 Tat pathway signal protein [Streptomyces chromofuscus]
MGRTRNVKLEAVVQELGLPQARLAARFCSVAAENNAPELGNVTQSHIARWIGGTRPSGRAPRILCETLSRGLGRVVTLADIGLALEGGPEPQSPEWSVDTLTTLVTLGGTDMDMDRRRVLVNSAYSIAGLALPTESWWEDAAERARTRKPLSAHTVTAQDVESVHEMTAFFSRRDQLRGGRGVGRTALVAYLRSEVADFLSGRFPSEGVRRAMTSAAGELAYLAGWTSFDAGEHPVALSWFTVATQLAEEARDVPLAGHIMRAMAHQAVDLKQPAEAVRLSESSLSGRRYANACWRERALLGVVHARGLAATGQKKQALAALLQAENDLGRAAEGEDEPGRVFFFGEASLAHETAAALRDLGDLKGAEKQFKHSVRTRRTEFQRTHSVTLGYLGSVQVQQGQLEAACETWHQALDAMSGVQSGRARETVVQMRRALSPFRNRGGSRAAELDAKARAVLGVG